jgi:mannose-6-phosphate isomerase-like protein (cupin superfamily)
MNRRGALPQVTGERRVSFLVLTLCLLVATGVTLLNIGLALRQPGVAAPLSARPAALNAALVREFYAAVNDAIRTGDAGALNAIVIPDFAWCLPCPGQLPTRDGLTRYLADLHRTVPGARLAVDSVIAGFQDTVMARVRVSGFPIVGASVPWGSDDLFRIAGGLIAERRQGTDDIALVEPLLRARFDALPPAVTGVAMARLTFPLGSGVEGLLSAGPTMLVVEAGAIAVRIANGGRIVRASGDETTPGNGAGLASVLHQGDAVIVPPGVRHALYQQGTEPAEAVGATLYFAVEGIDHGSRRGPELAPFFPPDRSVTASPPHFPVVRLLAAGPVDEWPTGPVSVAMGRAILGPGARVVPPEDESMLLAVEAGTLSVIGGEERTVAAGTGVVQPPGSVHVFRNAGDGLLVLLVLTVTPLAA